MGDVWGYRKGKKARGFPWFLALRVGAAKMGPGTAWFSLEFGRCCGTVPSGEDPHAAIVTRNYCFTGPAVYFRRSRRKRFPVPRLSVPVGDIAISCAEPRRGPTQISHLSLP